jgi:hypothetical protein
MKAKLPKEIGSGPKFLDYLIPEYLVACNDAILGQDNSITLVKIIDQLIAVLMPMQALRFFTVAQFVRKTEINLTDFIKAGLYYKVVLVKPSKKNDVVLAEGPIALDPENPWISTRLMNDVSGMLIFDEVGTHLLKIIGKTNHSEYETILEKRISIITAPGLSGLYMAHFYTGDDKTNAETAGEGVVMLLPNGSVQGGDHAYAYSGFYKLDGKTITAQLHIARQKKGIPSIFGDVDEFDIELNGLVDGLTIDAQGKIPGADDQGLKIQLVKQLKTPVMPAQSK